MKKCVVVSGVCAALLAAPAVADMKLVEEKQCLQCHEVAADRVGPSFKKVAAAWKGKKDAEKMLMATVRKGSKAGGGLHWAMKAEMPDETERPQVSEDEAKRIVRWIMKQ